MTSHEVYTGAEQAERVLEGFGGSIPAETRRQLELWSLARERLQRIRVETGEEFNVANLPSRTAALADIGRGEVYMSLAVLLGVLLHAARHEKGHLESGIDRLGLAEVTTEEWQGIAAQVGYDVPDAKQDDTHFLLEGLHEGGIFRKYGRTDKSGYASQHVPFAEKLDALALRFFKVSLIDLFAAGKKEAVVMYLRQLGQRGIALQQFHKIGVGDGVTVH